MAELKGRLLERQTLKAKLSVGGAISADWNAAEGESGHVRNRTHWAEEKTREIIVEGAAIKSGFASVKWITYDIADQYDAIEVVCNGVASVCPVIKGVEQMVGYVDPFFRVEGDGFSFVGYEGNNSVTYMGKANATFTLTGIKYTYHRLPGEYAPKLKSPGYREFDLGVTDDGAVTTTDGRGNIVEMAKKSDIPTGGGINVEDDGNGNVTITPYGAISVTDDGDGNVTIE